MHQIADVQYAHYADLPAVNYFSKIFPLGLFTIPADPYSTDAPNREKSTSQSIGFELYDSDLGGKTTTDISINLISVQMETTILYLNFENAIHNFYFTH